MTDCSEWQRESEKDADKARGGDKKKERESNKEREGGEGGREEAQRARTERAEGSEEMGIQGEGGIIIKVMFCCSLSMPTYTNSLLL